MRKCLIDNIYKDSKKLFGDNELITADARMSFLSDSINDLDIIAEFNGKRELLARYLDEDGDYNYTMVKKGVYMSIVKNLVKYEKLLALDGATYDPLETFHVEKEYGEAVTETEYGEVTDTITTAPRTNTNKDYTTAFNRSTEKEDSKTEITSVQTEDETTTGTHTDTVTRHTYTDTESGYKTAPQDIIEKERRTANYSTVNTIVLDTLNAICYAMYL